MASAQRVFVRPHSEVAAILSNIENIGAIETIKTHIDHLTKTEKDYYQITDIISFTEDETIAKRWAADLKPNDLLPAPAPYKETRYEFHLSIPTKELRQLDKDVRHFHYAFVLYPANG